MSLSWRLELTGYNQHLPSIVKLETISIGSVGSGGNVTSFFVT